MERRIFLPRHYKTPDCGEVRSDIVSVRVGLAETGSTGIASRPIFPDVSLIHAMLYADAEV
jgi:hypothetical protein